MPTNVVKTPADEARWKEAKRAARSSNGGKLSYALAMHIFENSKHKAGAGETAKSTANPVTRADVSPTDRSPTDQMDRSVGAEKRTRPRFVVGSKPTTVTDPPVQLPPSASHVAKGDEHPDTRRERNARPHNRAARREYMHSAAGAAANRKAQENYRNRHPERVAAQHAARSKHGESKGSGHSCATCGKPAVHKHHHAGYGSGAGEKVRWLCHDHHVKAHHPKSNLGEKSMKYTVKAGATPSASSAASLPGAPTEHGGGVQSPSSTAPMGKAKKKLEQEEKKEKSMQTPKVFEQIMKGAILKGEEGPDEMAHRMGAVELKRKVAKAEFKYAKAMKKAADAQARIAMIKKGEGGLQHVPMVDHPRPGAGVERQGSTDAGALTGAHEEHPPMVDHPRPGADSASKAFPFKPGADDKGKPGKPGDGKKPMPPWLKNKGKDDDAKDAAKKAGAGQGGFGGKPDAKTGDVEDHDEEDTKKSLDAMSLPELQAVVQKSYAKANEQVAKYNHLVKALSTLEHGEAGVGPGNFNGSQRTSADLGATHLGEVDGAPFGTLGSMNGMPGAPAAQETDLSEANRPVDQQMTDGHMPLTETVLGANGSSGLEASAHQVMGGSVSAGGGDLSNGIHKAMPGLASGSSGMPLTGAGALGPQVTQRRAADANAGRTWTQGMVHYSSNEDARVADLMQKSEQIGMGGTVLGEPTFNMRSPMLNTVVCANPLCKSRVPAMFAQCPACGNEHSGQPHYGAETGLVMSKSVADSIRGELPKSFVLPNGSLTIPD